MAQVIEDIWEQEGWPEEKENKSDENSVWQMAKRKHVKHKKNKNFKVGGFAPVAPMNPSMYRGSSGGIRGVGFDRPKAPAMVAPSSRPRRTLIPTSEPPPEDPVMNVPATAKSGLNKVIRRGPQMKDTDIATAWNKCT
jgi:hypothetical protein